MRLSIALPEFKALPRSRIFVLLRGPSLCALLLLAVIPFLASCAGANAGIAVSNVPVEGQTYTVLGPAEVTRSWWSFDAAVIAFPLAEPPVSLAVQDLLKQKEGDALINIRYWTDRTIILFMTRHRFHIQADVIRLDKKDKSEKK